MVCEVMLVVEEEGGPRRTSAANVATKLAAMRKKETTDCGYFWEPMPLLEWQVIKDSGLGQK